MVAVTVVHYLNLQEGLLYRASWLSFHGVGAMAVISATIDQELLDLRIALVFSILAALADGGLAVVELLRQFACPMGVTQLDIAICAATPTLSVVWAWVSVAMAALAVLQSILVAIWLSTRTGELRSLARYALLNAIRDGEAGTRRAADAQIEKRVYRGERRAMRALSRGGGAFRGVLTVLLLICVAFVAVVNGVAFRSGAFYRGALVIVPAHLVGAMFAFFGRTPTWWRWVCFVFALLSLLTSVTGVVLGWPRFARCLSASYTLQIERDICVQGGVFLAIAMPVASTLIAVLSLLAAIAMFRE